MKRIILLAIASTLAVTQKNEPSIRIDPSRLVRIWDQSAEAAGPRPIKPGERLWAVAEAAGNPTALATLGNTALLIRFVDEVSSRNFAVLDMHAKRAVTAGFSWAPELRPGIPSAFSNRSEFTSIRGLRARASDAISPWDEYFHERSSQMFEAMSRRFDGSAPSHVWLGAWRRDGKLGMFDGAESRSSDLRLDWYCSDALALKDFRDEMMSHYRSLRELNRVWGTSYRRRDEIGLPASQRDRFQWLDFVHWYRRRITESVVEMMERCREYLRDSIPTLPLPSNPDVRIGIDATSLIKSAAGKAIVSVPVNSRTPADELYASLNATAARFYGTSLAVELPSSGASFAALFRCLELGASGYVNRTPHSAESTETLVRMARQLTRPDRTVDVAMLYPSTSRFLDPNPPSPAVAQGCREIRDILDFDVVDEQPVRDGALDDYRILVLWEGTVYEADTLVRIRRWVEEGGILAAYDFGKIESAEKESNWFSEVFTHAARLKPAFVRRLASTANSAKPEIRIDFKLAKQQWARKMDRGWVVYFPARRSDIDGYYELIRFLTYRRSDLDESMKSVVEVDNTWDGVQTLASSDRIIAFNPGSREVPYKAKPIGSAISHLASIPAGTMLVMPLSDRPTEMLLQCEKFTQLGGLRPQTGMVHSPGNGLTHILIPTGGSISTRFECAKKGRYRVLYRAVRRGAKASVEIEIDGKVLRGDTDVRGALLSTSTLLAGEVELEPGIRAMTLRPRQGEDARADYVVLTTDGSISGYAFTALPIGK